MNTNISTQQSQKTTKFVNNRTYLIVCLIILNAVLIFANVNFLNIKYQPTWSWTAEKGLDIFKEFNQESGEVAILKMNFPEAGAVTFHRIWVDDIPEKIELNNQDISYKFPLGRVENETLTQLTQPVELEVEQGSILEFGVRDEVGSNVGIGFIIDYVLTSVQQIIED